jgi:hypothetical protein
MIVGLTGRQTDAEIRNGRIYLVRQMAFHFSKAIQTAAAP